MSHLFAYLDPGAGSMLLQMILAGVLGLSLTIKTYWRSIVRLVRRDKSDDHPTDDTSSAKDRL